MEEIGWPFGKDGIYLKVSFKEGDLARIKEIIWKIPFRWHFAVEENIIYFSCCSSNSFEKIDSPEVFYSEEQVSEILSACDEVSKLSVSFDLRAFLRTLKGGVETDYYIACPDKGRKYNPYKSFSKFLVFRDSYEFHNFSELGKGERRYAKVKPYPVPPYYTETQVTIEWDGDFARVISGSNYFRIGYSFGLLRDFKFNMKNASMGDIEKKLKEEFEKRGYTMEGWLE